MIESFQLHRIKYSLHQLQLSLFDCRNKPLLSQQVFYTFYHYTLLHFRKYLMLTYAKNTINRWPIGLDAIWLCINLAKRFVALIHTIAWPSQHQRQAYKKQSITINCSPYCSTPKNIDIDEQISLHPQASTNYIRSSDNSKSSRSSFNLPVRFNQFHHEIICRTKEGLFG